MIILHDVRLQFMRLQSIQKMHIRIVGAKFTECGICIVDLIPAPISERAIASEIVCKKCVRTIKVASRGSMFLRISESEGAR